VHLQGNIGRFLGVIVHEHDIQIDPKKIKSIGKIGELVCKKDVQKLLSKINYLYLLVLIKCQFHSPTCQVNV
jgi:hypothetical protein